jgi:cytoskeletal protein CcmA (bactofilin family)
VRKKSPHFKTDTLVGEDTIIEGKIVSQAGIRIEGQVIGDIESAGHVTVGERAMLLSNIVAREVTIAGTVHGNVTSPSRLVITATGQLTGEIEAGSLTVMEGGVFQGVSKMEARSAEEQAVQSARETKKLRKLRQQKQSGDAVSAAN